MAETAVLVDANVLFDSNLRDVVIWLKILRLPVRATEEIISEALRNVGERIGDPARAERLRDKVVLAMRDALVEDFQSLIPQLALSAGEDRHVLAAAVKGGCRVIVTYNLADFPGSEVERHGVVAVHPDAWLCQLLDERPDLVIRAVDEASKLRKRAPRTPLEIVEALARRDRSGMIEFAERFKRDHVSRDGRRP